MTDDVEVVELRVLASIASVIGLAEGAHLILAGGLRGRHPVTEGYLVVRRFDIDPSHGPVRNRFNDRGWAFPLWENGRATDIDEGDLVMYADEIANGPFEPGSGDAITWGP